MSVAATAAPNRSTAHTSRASESFAGPQSLPSYSYDHWPGSMTVGHQQPWLLSITIINQHPSITTNLNITTHHQPSPITNVNHHQPSPSSTNQHQPLLNHHQLITINHPTASHSVLLISPGRRKTLPFPPQLHAIRPRNRGKRRIGRIRARGNTTDVQVVTQVGG